jgi:hypothetical protein
MIYKRKIHNRWNEYLGLYSSLDEAANVRAAAELEHGYINRKTL